MIAILVVGGLSALFLRPGGAPAAQSVRSGFRGRSEPCGAERSKPGEPGRAKAKRGPKIRAASVVQANNGVVRIALTDLVGQEASSTPTRTGTKTIPFFVMRSSDGVVRAAFDACDVCFASKKGYHQEGDEMVCNNCGSRFPSAQINEVKGGCNPSPLDRAVQGDDLIIEVEDLQAGANYF